MGTIRGKSPKQSLTSVKDLTIELPQGKLVNTSVFANNYYEKNSADCTLKCYILDKNVFSKARFTNSSILKYKNFMI